LHKQKKTKKVIFGIKECYFSDCTNKQTKKNPQKKHKKTTHTIVGREKWLLYFQVVMVPLHSSTSLKMCFSNVGGLKNKEGSKLEDLFFIKKTQKNHPHYCRKRKVVIILPSVD
jgi:hypothetical protein